MSVNVKNEIAAKYYIHNGEYKEADKTKNNLEIEGKCIYEVLRVIDKVPLFLERHLWRLENSSELGNIKLNYTDEEIKAYIDKLIKVNEAVNENIKLVFGEKGDFLIYIVKHSYPSEKDYKDGVATIFYHGERNNPNAKIINKDLRENVDVLLKKHNAYEAVLVDNDGFITEGSKSNIFMVKSGSIYTSPLTEVLPGITRQAIMEICKKIGITVTESKISYKNIEEYEALFITGTSPKVLPINSVDNVEFTSYSNNIVLEVMKAYNNTIVEYVKNYELKPMKFNKYKVY